MYIIDDVWIWRFAVGLHFIVTHKL